MRRLQKMFLNFVTWSNNQALFTTAESRLAQIDNLANSPLFSESLDVQNDYEAGGGFLKDGGGPKYCGEKCACPNPSPPTNLFCL